MRRVQPSRGLSALFLFLLTGACSGTSNRGGGPAGAGGGAGGASASGNAGSTAPTGGAGSAPAGGAGSGGTGAPAGSGGTGGVDATAGGAGATPTGGTGGAPSDGGGTEGGQAGAGAAGSGADAGGVGGYGYSGASRCGTAGVLLCESFENGLDAAIWTPLISGEGTATVDGLHAFRGTKALHINVVNTGHKAAISETKTFPIATNLLYARLFVWFDVFTTTAHFTMAEAPQTAAGAWIRFGGQGGKYGVGTDHGASGDWLQQDTTPIPTKQWTCIEFAFRGDTNQFHVWMDDVERTALNVGPTQHAGFAMPAFTSLWFGWQTYSNQAPGELWIDEIAIDSKPIGCAK
jgi:hypothetical protein